MLEIQWSSYGISLNCSENNIVHSIGYFQMSFIGFHKNLSQLKTARSFLRVLNLVCMR